MKRFLSFVYLAVILISLTGCGDDDVLWDIAPTRVQLNVVNQDGENLLDPNVDGNIWGETATLIIDGKSTDYVIERNPRSRAMLAIFYGVYLENLTGTEYLTIGEWQTEKSAEYDMTLIIRGKSYSIRVVNDFKWKHNEPKIKRTYFLDGKQTDNPMTIVL